MLASRRSSPTKNKVAFARQAYNDAVMSTTPSARRFPDGRAEIFNFTEAGSSRSNRRSSARSARLLHLK